MNYKTRPIINRKLRILLKNSLVIIVFSIDILLRLKLEGSCKIEVRHILFKKIFFLIFLNNHLTDY